MLTSLEKNDVDEEQDESRKFIVLDPVERSTNDANPIKEDGSPTARVARTSETWSQPIGSEQDTLFRAKDGKASSVLQPESALSQLQKNFKNVYKEVRMK